MIRPSKVKQVLKCYLAADTSISHPIFIWGAPGVGKSALVQEVGQELNLRVVDLRMSLLDPTDLRGIPFRNDGQAVWATPSFLPRSKDGDGILFLDELNAAPTSVQTSAYQLVLNR